MVPNLIHPVPVELEQLSTASTFYDEDAREPVQQVARATKVTLSGQVSWGEDEGLQMEATGRAETATGYVLFRRIDLAAVAVTIRINDRFTKLGGIVTNVYVVRLQWLGHYPDQGGPTLLKAWFQDRSQVEREVV